MVEGTTPLIESTSDQISNTFDSQQVQSLPMGNTFDSLALFLPGVATAGDVSFSNNNGAELSVNGERARANNFRLMVKAITTTRSPDPPFSLATRTPSRKYKWSQTTTLSLAATRVRWSTT
jgi:hypothetical protein